MDDTQRYITYVRERITDLRTQKDVSEHRMSLELGKSGSYIRGITSGGGSALLTGAVQYYGLFGSVPSEFFDGLDDPDSLRTALRGRLMELNDEDLQKVSSFLDWMWEVISEIVLFSVLEKS